MNRLASILTCLFAMIWIAAPAIAEKPDLPMPAQYVQDYAGVINSSDKKTLLGVLHELEQKTGAQYIVLTVNTTEGMPIEEFSIKLAEKWKLGQKGKDNGFLFTIAIKDRKYRFEVGRGLEGYVTDMYCGQMGRDILVPYLKDGQYSLGITTANLAIVSAMAQAAGVTLTGMPGNSYRNNRDTRQDFRSLQWILLILILVGVLGVLKVLQLLGLYHGFDSDDSWWGGGGGGGGFGGFGGGGGGSFGGGGASGGW